MAVIRLQLNGTLVAGGSANLVVAFQNKGPNPAPNARLSVTFSAPVGIQVTSTSAGARCSASNALSCSAGTLAKGKTVTIRATVRVSSTATGGLQVRATASSNLPDPNPGDNAKSLRKPISTSADLVLSQSISPNPPVPRATVTIRDSVTNHGPSDARNVVVTLSVPAGASLSGASGSCSGGGSKLTCGVGSLSAGSSASVQLTITLTGLSAGSQLRTAASVKSATRDPNNGNNSASASYPVAAATADLSISASTSPSAAVRGAQVELFVAVNNSGPSDSEGVVVTDTLPVGLRFLSASSTAGGCSAIGNTIICELGTIPAGSGASITILAQVSAFALLGPLGNSASVSSDTSDRNLADNEASATLSVTSTPTPGTTPPPVANVADATSTTISTLPRTGEHNSPLAMASMLLALGILLVAVGFRRYDARD